jgi:hypothetical protein
MSFGLGQDHHSTSRSKRTPRLHSGCAGGVCAGGKVCTRMFPFAKDIGWVLGGYTHAHPRTHTDTKNKRTHGPLPCQQHPLPAPPLALQPNSRTTNTEMVSRKRKRDKHKKTMSLGPPSITRSHSSNNQSLQQAFLATNSRSPTY